jgi:hypothetical protein
MPFMEVLNENDSINTCSINAAAILACDCCSICAYITDLVRWRQRRVASIN